MSPTRRRAAIALLVAGLAAATLADVGWTTVRDRTAGPGIALLLAVTLAPALVKGARARWMAEPSAWAAALVGGVVPLVATVGVDPAVTSPAAVAWWIVVVLIDAVLLDTAGRTLQAVVLQGCLLLHAVLWAGPFGAMRLGVGVGVIVFAAALATARMLRRTAAAAAAVAASDRATEAWQIEQDAVHLDRQLRLHLAGRDASPMLHRIVDRAGDLEAADRAGCRVLEQTLRDEVRGRRLLNDAVRRAILAHRRRGARVQVLDDGGLDDVPPGALNRLLDDLAARIAPLTSTNIVLRTGQPGSPTAVTLVATTPDETAAALGLDDDERVDAWVEIPRAAVAV